MDTCRHNRNRDIHKKLYYAIFTTHYIIIKQEDYFCILNDKKNYFYNYYAI